MKKKVFFKTRDIQVTHWVDDFDVYRWDVALTRKAAAELPKKEFDRLVDAFNTIGEVLSNASKREAGEGS